MPETVVAQARGWLYSLAQRVPLTDPPTWVSRKQLYEEMLLPLAVLGHFNTPDSFFATVPGLRQRAGSLALQPELHRALLEAAGRA
jgi:hypothetical protein